MKCIDDYMYSYFDHFNFVVLALKNDNHLTSEMKHFVHILFMGSDLSTPIFTQGALSISEMSVLDKNGG